MKPDGGAVKIGTPIQLNLFAIGSNGGTDLIPASMATWTSAPPTVAEMNRQGRLNPRRPGTVTVTAAHGGKTVQAVFTVGD